MIASAIVARIEVGANAHTMTWSNAGHPPPVLVTREGMVELLERPADLLLGLPLAPTRHDHRIELRPGDTVVLYTDGLIERPDEIIDDGFARLTASLAGAHQLSLDQLCAAILAEHRTNRRDDIALLVMRISLDERGGA